MFVNSRKVIIFILCVLYFGGLLFYLFIIGLCERRFNKKNFFLLYIGLYGDFFILLYCFLILWLRLFIERFVIGFYYLWIDVLYIYCFIRVIIYRMYLLNYIFVGNIYMFR